MHKSNNLKGDQSDHTANCKAKLRMHTNEENEAVKHLDIQPIISNLLFNCDPCISRGVSDKRPNQHIRMKHKISQVDGNNSESDDCNSLSEGTIAIDKD